MNVSSSNTHQINELWLRFLALLHQNDLDHALERANEIADIDPNHALGPLGVGMVYARMPSGAQQARLALEQAYRLSEWARSVTNDTRQWLYGARARRYVALLCANDRRQQHLRCALADIEHCRARCTLPLGPEFMAERGLLLVAADDHRGGMELLRQACAQEPRQRLAIQYELAVLNKQKVLSDVYLREILESIREPIAPALEPCLNPQSPHEQWDVEDHRVEQFSGHPCLNCRSLEASVRAAEASAAQGISPLLCTSVPSLTPRDAQSTDETTALSDQARMKQALKRAWDEIYEQRFMSAACRRADEFQVSRVLGSGDIGMVALVTCSTPGFPWPAKPYALKVCFNFELDTNQARNAYINEFIELVKLPSHPNIIRFMCEFVDEIHDNIRQLLPQLARERAIKVHQDGTQTNRKTQFFVLEFVERSLSRLLGDSFTPPSIVPDKLVATIMSQVGSGLQHLDRHRLVHRDLKTDNIMVETRVNSSTNEIEVIRCVLIDFGMSCRLNEQRRSTVLVSDTGGVLGPQWGNPQHIAPELHSALESAMGANRRQEVELDYSRQAVFELGVLGFEIVNGCHPVLEYPGSVTSRATRTVQYGDDDIAQISPDRLGSEQASMLRRAVSCDPSRRPSLDELIRCFDRTGELGVENSF